MPDQENLSYEQQIRGYENRIANILENLTDAFFEVDKNWTVTYWNKEAENLLFMRRHEILGRNLWEVYQDAIPLKFFSEYHRAMEKNEPVRFEEYFAPKQLWLEVAAFPSENGLSVYFKDITERKNTLIKLQNEKQKYIALFNSSPVPQWVYDFESLRFLDVNKAAIHHYGYSRMEFMDMTILDILPDHNIDEPTVILSQEVKTDPFNKSTVCHKKKNGEIIDVSVEENMVGFENKNACLVVIIDRTAELQAKKAMEESIERFNIVSKATSDAIWDWNIETGEMTWNRGITGIFGHRKTAYSHQWWREHVHPEDLESVLKKIELLIKNGKDRFKTEYRFKGANGTYHFVQDRAFLSYSPDGIPTRMIGSLRDITAQVRHTKAMEEQNIRLKEISWIQSHKIRSPLAKILGIISLIKDERVTLQEIKELIPYLKISAEELDKVISEIVKKTG